MEDDVIGNVLLASVHQLLDILQRVVCELAAFSFELLDSCLQAIVVIHKVYCLLRELEFLLKLLEDEVDGHSVRELLLEFQGVLVASSVLVFGEVVVEGSISGAHLGRLVLGGGTEVILKRSDSISKELGEHDSGG